MRKSQSLFYQILLLFLSGLPVLLCTGCANMIPPTGGPRDSLPPVLVAALPKDSATNFTGNKITLNFDEFVEIQNAFENVLVSPTPNNVPTITSRFHTVTISEKPEIKFSCNSVVRMT